MKRDSRANERTNSRDRERETEREREKSVSHGPWTLALLNLWMLARWARCCMQYATLPRTLPGPLLNTTVCAGIAELLHHRKRMVCRPTPWYISLAFALTAASSRGRDTRVRFRGVGMHNAVAYSFGLNQDENDGSLDKIQSTRSRKRFESNAQDDWSSAT